MRETLTIIIPLFNEEENIQRLDNELSKFLKISIVDSQVLFINDGSTDNSEDILRKICESKKKFKLISFKKNHGLSTAIKAGFDYAETTLIGYIDADLQTNPEDFNLLLKKIDKNDLVTGYRKIRKDSIIKSASSFIANKIRRLFTRDEIIDTGCPLKIIRTSFAKKIPMFKGLHRFLPAMILLQNGKVSQVPIKHYPRKAGKAKYGFFNRLIEPFIDCIAYLWIKNKYIDYQIKDNQV